MKTGKAIPFAALSAALSLAAPVATAATCAEHEIVVDRLHERYGESLFGTSVSPTGAILEIYRNAQTWSWTVLVALPDEGLACLAASGSGDDLLHRSLSELES